MHDKGLPDTMAARSAQLAGLGQRLTACHFGIEKEVQAVLDAFSPWYRFAETQQRPSTVGLWGMTGTGKSSLVRALVREMELEDRTYWLDGGECQKHSWLDEVFQRLEEHLNGAPFILVVDEFQHARTLDNGRPQKEPGELRRFWELLDAGRVVTWPRIYSGDTALIDFRARLVSALEAGAVVERGRVVKGLDHFRSMVWKHYDHKRGDRCAVPRELWYDFRHMSGEPATSLTEIELHLSGMDGHGLLHWLDKLRTEGQRTRVVDAGKALIILLGNLDELYVMDKEPLAELDPDVLLQRHRDIGRAGVQQALLQLFRIEQVARLGTSHVVFPPIGRSTTDALVRKEAETLAARLSAHCGRKVSVEGGLLEYLGNASPIAVMGARPLVEAVQHLVGVLLGQAMDHPWAEQATAIVLGISDGSPFATLHFGKRKRRMNLKWPAGRGPVQEHRPAHLERSAVHETGHLLCGTLLCGLRPLQVCARTRDPHIQGFVAWDRSDKQLLTRTEVVPRLAMLLGGWAAEHMRYGPEGISSGSRNDLEKATAVALDLLKRHGMGADRLHHAEFPSVMGGGIRGGLAAVEEQARRWMEEAEQLALGTLEEHSALFHACVERLQEKGTLGMQELDDLLNNTHRPAPIAADEARRTLAASM